MNGRYELPDALLAVRLSIFGRSGYGKTNVAKRGVERLLTSKRRVGIIDPTDSWYGLRKKPDGKGDAFGVIIFGGEFGDLPLNEHAGATIGRALAAAKESWIVSLAEMPGEGARKRFTADLLSALYDHNRAPLHLIVDEADTIAPQRQNSPAESICVARMEQIVKRGRKRGFVPWLITQRPADVATSVRSQTDALVSLSLTLPHDIKAVRSWVAEHDEDGTAAKLFAEITKLPKGEGIVWWPGHGVLERASFAKTKTFDSGKTPEAGDVRVKLKPLKVDTLAKAVADLIKEREENDPNKLRARIAELELAVAGQRADDHSDAYGKGQEVGFRDGQEEGRKAGYAAGYADAAKVAGESFLAIQNKVAEDVATIRAELGHNAAAAHANASGSPLKRPNFGKVGLNIEPREPPPAPKPAAIKLNGDAGRLRPGEVTILTALAQVWPKGLHPDRIAARSRMARGGGTFKTYFGRLKSLGFVQVGDDGVTITASGKSTLGPFERLPTGAALRERWKSELRPGEVKILDAVAKGHTSADAIGQDAAMPPTGGTFKTYMGRLKSLGLVAGDGRQGFRLHEDLR